MSINSNQDPFDEFEFKPLTAGLGFHKKETSNQNTKIDFSTSHLDFNNQSSPFAPPLPRPQQTPQGLTARPVATKPTISVPTLEDDSILKAQSAVNEILKNLNHKKQQEDQLLKRKKVLAWKNTTSSIAAAALDCMLISALFLMCLIGLISTTKIDLLTNLLNPGQYYQVWIATGVLFLSLVTVYMILFRTYLTYTPGEWAFDQRCGSDIQIASSTYSLKVAARSLINSATGLVILPLLSIIMKKDLAGQISGVTVQKLSA